MTPDCSTSCPDLVDLLASWMGVDCPPEMNQVTEGLSRLLDMNQSIQMAQVLQKSRSFSGSGITRPEKPEELLVLAANTRRWMQKSVMDSFDQNSPTLRLIVLPAPSQEPAFDSYQRFYIAHQREFDQRIGSASQRLREALVAVSPRTAVLDAGLGQILQAPLRRLLGKLPRLLQQRFRSLQAAPEAAGFTGTPSHPQWLGQFCKDLQQLLLAELHWRLQPLEALQSAWLEVSDARSASHIQPSQDTSDRKRA